MKGMMTLYQTEFDMDAYLLFGLFLPGTLSKLWVK